MNQRIKELVKVAEYWANSFEDKSKYQEYLMQTFAELIVRECTQVAIKKQTENDMDNIVSKNPARDFAYALIEHFGVEE